MTRMARMREGERTAGAGTQIPAFFTTDYTDVLDCTDGEEAGRCGWAAESTPACLGEASLQGWRFAHGLWRGARVMAANVALRGEGVFGLVVDGGGGAGAPLGDGGEADVREATLEEEQEGDRSPLAE